MKFPKIGFSVNVAAVLFAATAAAAEPISCPGTIVVAQQLQAAVPGWSTMLEDTPHMLSAVTFYDGPPEQRASLVNDKSKTAAGKETATWLFQPRTERRIWIGCTYTGTTVVMKREVPAGIGTCSVTYNSRQRLEGLPVIEKIACH